MLAEMDEATQAAFVLWVRSYYGCAPSELSSWPEEYAVRSALLAGVEHGCKGSLVAVRRLVSTERQLVNAEAKLTQLLTAAQEAIVEYPFACNVKLLKAAVEKADDKTG